MKTVLLTGASSGIGLATGKKLASEGYLVFGIGRTFDESLIYPENFLRFSCDITDRNALHQLLSSIKSTYSVSAPDIVIQNAGVGYYGLHETLSEDTICELVRTNIEAPMLLTSMLLPYMKQRGSGQFIFISSVTARKQNTHGCAYGATKAALLSFAGSLFEEVRKHGIKVTTILPDMTKTSLYRNADFTTDDTACLFADDIADTISSVLSLKEHINLTELTVQPQKHRIQRGKNHE